MLRKNGRNLWRIKINLKVRSHERLADWHELLAAKPLATMCSNTQPLSIGKECVHLFMKGGKIMKSCQITATTCSNERYSRRN